MGKYFYFRKIKKRLYRRLLEILISVSLAAFVLEALLEKNGILVYGLRNLYALIVNSRLVLFILIFLLAISLFYIARIIIKRGDISTNQSGYQLYKFAGFQHRLIAERCLGRKLQPGEEVHHINGRPTDNNPSNLCVLHRYDHHAFHYWLKETRARLGRYPSIQNQRDVLQSRFGGILF